MLFFCGVMVDDARGVNVALHFVSQLSSAGFSAEWLITFHNSLVDLSIVGHYYALRWAITFLPYYCAGLTLAAPLFSALGALAGGHLIGYIYVGYYCTSLVLLSLFASFYVLFIFPMLRWEYLEYASAYMAQCTRHGDGLLLSLHEIRYACGAVFKPGPSYILDSCIGNPLADELFVNTRDGRNLNLALDFADFISTPFLHAKAEFVVDSVSIIMVFTITCISFFVHLYSTVYMRTDPHVVRFLGFLSLFTFFMIFLVTSANLIMLYIGWEGVGLSSFLLIAFWFTRVSALKAALKAVLINKIGDMFLVLGIGILTTFTAGSTNIATLPVTFTAEALASPFAMGLTSLDLVALCLVMAAFVKSAQLFFHTWLPDAMEGPTPVSALLHAATMVTAGVYLVVRFSCIIEYSPLSRSIIFFGGLGTIIFSSLVALFQFDIKKIIAYSTCSQLGLMFLACGLSAYDLALFHFFNHAFFKCLLFLLAGVIIHELGNEQDIRRMGGLAAAMPLTFTGFSAASLSLMGVPLFSGAISKDLILLLVNYTACCAGAPLAKLFLIFINSIIFLTVAYSARLVYYVFIAPAKHEPRFFDDKKYVEPLRVEGAYTFIAVTLAMFSAFGGRLFAHLFVLTDGYYVSVHEEITVRGTCGVESLFAEHLKSIPLWLTVLSLLAVLAV